MSVKMHGEQARGQCSDSQKIQSRIPPINSGNADYTIPLDQWPIAASLHLDLSCCPSL